jgi:hypothetical protein
MNLRQLTLGLLMATAIATPTFAQDRADDENTFITTFNTLTKGMASATMVWNLNGETVAQSNALQAFLSAKLNSGTDEIPTRDSIDFRTINAVDFMIRATPTHLLLSVEAPQETFSAAVDHLGALLAAPGVNENWLKRQTRAFRSISSTRLRTPELLESELSDYALYTGETPTLPSGSMHTEILRRPNQIILNGKEYDFDNTADVLLAGLITIEARLNDFPAPERRALPRGTIHLVDPDATETLVFMGRLQEYDDVHQQAQADTLYKYMGYGPGSEMFRIVRQERRASYDPRSHFNQIGERLAITGLSATVPSTDWPEIHSVIAQIYDDARAGKNDQQGLDDSQNAMLNSMIGDLRREPDWLARRYLELYPIEPPKGRINLDLINAAFDMDTTTLNDFAADVLPPRDDMLNIIIGGSISPSAALRANGFCELQVGEPLEKCLDALVEG